MALLLGLPKMAHRSIIMTLIIASLVCAIEAVPVAIEEVPIAIETVPVTYSCSGSTLCGKAGLPNGGQCDAAKRNIQSNNRYFTGGGSGSTGVCSGHCGLFVSGSNCDLFGSEMNTAFDELRNFGCRICGVKTFDDGCQFKMDYVNGC